MAAQLLASVLTDPSIGGLPTYVFIIIAAAVLIIGIIVLIAVSRAGTKKAKRKATRIVEETPQPAPDNEEAAPEAQDVPVADGDPRRHDDGRRKRRGQPLHLARRFFRRRSKDRRGTQAGAARAAARLSAAGTSTRAAAATGLSTTGLSAAGTSTRAATATGLSAAGTAARTAAGSRSRGCRRASA